LPSSRTSLLRVSNPRDVEMGIEAPLIVNAEGTPFKNLMELPNGCICCSAKYWQFGSRNDLLAAIEYLVEINGIRRVVVETNGVADPANVRSC
jgi:G3E family GTPase